MFIVTVLVSVNGIIHVYLSETVVTLVLVNKSIYSPFIIVSQPVKSCVISINVVDSHCGCIENSVDPDQMASSEAI